MGKPGKKKTRKQRDFRIARSSFRHAPKAHLSTFSLKNPEDVRQKIAIEGVRLTEIALASGTSTQTVARIVRGHPVSAGSFVRVVDVLRTVHHIEIDPDTDIRALVPDRKLPPPPRRGS